MTISIQIGGRNVGLDSPIDISIPLNFNGPQPTAYGVEPASSKPCEAGDLVGDTRRGGSVNFERYTFIPHCNGTHTECVGHITHERISVRDCLQDVFIFAVLVSVEPVRASKTDETYSVELGTDDRLITRKTLERRHLAGNERESVPKTDIVRDVGRQDAGVPKALIVRTLPNDDGKLTRQYGEDIPPFFSTEAMEYIVKYGFRHVLVDVPSIDRLFDKGKLSNHRIFWNVEPGSCETHEATRIYSTVTELIYVPNQVEDGEYLLNLQIAPFAADASPSRPILFKIV